jgi:hypothetical protein
MATKSTAWHKPELIVLVRNRPEEAVLAACKHGNVDGPTLLNKCQKTNCQVVSNS